MSKSQRNRVRSGDCRDDVASPVKRMRECQVVLDKIITGIASPAREETEGSEMASTSQAAFARWTSRKEPVLTVTAREKQFKMLKATFGSPERALPGTIFLWGGSSSGKSHTLEKVLEGTDVKVVKVHSSEILCGKRAFYETIVRQVVETTLAPSFKCDSLRSLYHNVTAYFDEDEDSTKMKKKGSRRRVVIIVEAVESLRGENDDILQFLVSLQDCSQAPVCVVFISTLPPGRFMPNVMDRGIIPFYFPQYTGDELVQILSEQRIPRSRNSKGGSCYDFYIKMIVSMFSYVCRDLRKLLRLATTHWETFNEMVEESLDLNLTKLWKKLEPQLKSQFFEMNSTISTREQFSDQNQDQPGKVLDVPSNAKYLLISAYLATHNPPSSDKRFFVKAKTAKAKKPRIALKTDANNSQPFARSFELNRLKAIFSSVQVYCDESAVNKNINISFTTLLHSLCQSKLIQYLGEDSAGNQKYKCLLDYDAVLDISRSVEFELNNYLYRLL